MRLLGSWLHVFSTSRHRGRSLPAIRHKIHGMMKEHNVAFGALGIAFEPCIFYGYSKRWRFDVESVVG
jgi:hypothetical protein